MFTSASSKNETPAKEIFDLFSDFDSSFSASPYPQYSPQYALIKQLIKNLRVHGHYGQHEAEVFLKPDGHSAATDPLFPQDAIAALIRLLFPSSVGLVVNSGLKDKLNDFLTPKNVGEIFKIIAEPGYTQQQLFDVLLPDKIKAKWLRCKNRNAFTVDFIYQERWKYLQDLTHLLFAAFKVDEGDTSVSNRYPPHIVKRVLLCYLWEKFKCNKANLKTLTEVEKSTLAKLGYSYFIDRFPPAVDYGISCWNGHYYSDCGDTLVRNYFMMVLYNFETRKFDVSKLKELKWYYNVSDKLIHYFEYDCTCPAEADTLRARYAWSDVVNDLNASRFDESKRENLSTIIGALDKFIFCFNDIRPEEGDALRDKTWKGIMDELNEARKFIFMEFCNYTMMDYDVSRLKKKLKELRNVRDKLRHYCEHVSTDPEKTYILPDIDAWSEAVDNINATKWFKNSNINVKYMSENGDYGIDVGLDNILKVIGNLLGGPFEMDMSDQHTCVYNLNELCKLFSECDQYGYIMTPEANSWEVKLSAYNRKNDPEDAKTAYYSKCVPRNGWVDLTLTFKYGNDKDGRKDIFECHIENRHFGCNRCLPDPEQNGLNDDIDNFPEFLFNCRIDTLSEKVQAIEKIYHFSQRTGSNQFQYLIDKWMEKSGSHFASWRNIKINSMLAAVLVKYMSTEDILTLRIPELTNAIVFPLVKMRRTADIKMVLEHDLNQAMVDKQALKDEHLRNLKNTILLGTSQDLNDAVKIPLHERKFSRVARVLEQTLLKGTDEDLLALLIAGANPYAKQVWDMSLLHLAAFSGNKRLTLSSLSQLGIDVNARTGLGETPLHFAVQSGSPVMVEKLLELGANVHALTKKWRISVTPRG